MPINEFQENPLVSVVSPCYNVERYLSRFLECILSQTYKNIEIILVNDGSTDNTGYILDDIASKDNRVSIIHKSNGGCSSARLAGIKRASGEYIYSCDPDDYMELNCIQALVDTAHASGADIIYCDYDCMYTDRTVPVIYKLNNLDKLTYLHAQLAGGMWGVFWNKLIRKSLLDEYHVYPDARVSLWDDYHVVNGCAAFANKIAYCPKVLYHYNCENQDSIMHNVSLKSFESIVLAIKLLEKHFERSGVMQYVKHDFLQLCAKNKEYLLFSQYRNFRKWRELWPESNSSELSKSKGINKLMIKYIINGNYRAAYVLSLIQRIISHFSH